MMDFSEKYGKDIDEAVTLALRDLKATIDEVEVILLEEPSKGFLGIGSKLAKVRVELKTKEEEPKVTEEPKFIEDRKENEEVRDRHDVEEKEGASQTARSGEKSARSKKGRKDRKPKKPQNKEKSAGADKDSEVEGSHKSVRTSINVRPEDLKPVEDHVALDFLRSTAEKMKLELTFSAEENAENLYIDIEGKDAGTIIGKRGQTLDAIQYLTSLVVNKDKENYVRVVLDAENYREKREKTLERLADRLAGKVIKTGRSVRLEPMNPYERMVIHAALHQHPKVKTRSEGEEPYRRVIIELK